jgi:hypothetical protein
MSTPIPVSAPALPWYQSPVQKAQVVAAVSALVALSPKIGSLVGIKTPAEASAWVESLFGAITFIAPILGTIWRARSALQPLTLTKAGAAAHPATVAATVAAMPVSQPAAPAVDPTKPWGKI